MPYTPKNGLLIILGGLPGVGKTTIARLLAEKLGAMHLRIDTIEAVLKSAFPNNQNMDDKGYLVAYDIAKDNLRLGKTVIADSVNPVEITRQAWRDVATDTHKNFIEVEFICSNSSEHKKRVETRSSDIKGLTPPTWEKVQSRDYQPWDLKGLQLDTATLTAEVCVNKIIQNLWS